MLNTITATRHALERRVGSLRHSSHHWELVCNGRILGGYERGQYSQAIKDAACLRNGNAVVDVRKSLTRGATR